MTAAGSGVAGGDLVVQALVERDRRLRRALVVDELGHGRDRGPAERGAGEDERRVLVGFGGRDVNASSRRHHSARLRRCACWAWRILRSVARSSSSRRRAASRASSGSRSIGASCSAANVTVRRRSAWVIARRAGVSAAPRTPRIFGLALQEAGLDWETQSLADGRAAHAHLVGQACLGRHPLAFGQLASSAAASSSTARRSTAAWGLTAPFKDPSENALMFRTAMRPDPERKATETEPPRAAQRLATVSGGF
jgi:hypothetical protein